MKKPTIDISIGKDGKVRIKVHGVSGQECVRLTDAIAQIVGREESREMTSEFYGGEQHVGILGGVRAKHGG
jgi:hypothetical protein